MLPWIRRLVTVVVVALLTAGASLWWLYDGDLEQGVEPVVRDMQDAAAPVMGGPGLGGGEPNDAPPAVIPE